ncbi:hypothetical protein FHL15_006679 [Xylaria flabelliformis]|uniref:DZF domain-containing protein n=1 Tax=Xylaria flabelliformis TaxID=2512241 RepID=A0A553HX42_9PEZI|nr:hypothetical protein FHL15_006679 [Xylaria flabelliformis]
MSSSGQSFGSNNPFRRKPGAASGNPAASSSSLSFGTDEPSTSSTTTTRPPLTTFKSAAPENERRDEEEQPMQQKPKKIIKKVRVQSPPPSSPEDSILVARFPALEQLDDDNNDGDNVSDSSKSDVQEDDPFSVASVDSDSKLTAEPPVPQIPPNPFARTLQDIERSGQVRDANATTMATSASKGSLDVDSFKRLLLTGQSNLPGPAQAAVDSAGNPSGAAHTLGALQDGASATDASSISKQSIFDALQETPRTSHEISESETPEDGKGLLPSSPLTIVSSASVRKKPPPPSSRHGKLIKMDLGADINSRGAPSATSAGAPDLPSPLGVVPRKVSSESATTLHSSQGTDVNKPLPAPPLRAATDEDIESPFDREAAGKVPEAFAELQAHPRPPTPPPTTRSRSGSQTSTQSRKPAAPPPRRHGRSESKAPSIYHNNTNEDPPRSSMESTHSRAESLRISANSAPAPPPPRRPGHVRQGSSFAGIGHGGYSAISPSLSEKERSPLGSSFTPMASPSIQSGYSHSSSTATSGANGQIKLSPPPPPPTRKQSIRRPPSVRSMESNSGPAPLRRVSREKEGGALPPPPPPPRARGGSRKGSTGSVTVGNGSVTPTALESKKQGEDILADLDALQREVDELMKKAAN